MANYHDVRPSLGVEDKKFADLCLKQAQVIWRHFSKIFEDPSETPGKLKHYALVYAFALAFNYERVNGLYVERIKLPFGELPRGLGRAVDHTWISVHVERGKEPWVLDVFRQGDWRRRLPVLEHGSSKYYSAPNKREQYRLVRHLEEQDSFHTEVEALLHRMRKIARERDLDG